MRFVLVVTSLAGSLVAVEDLNVQWQVGLYSCKCWHGTLLLSPVALSSETGPFSLSTALTAPLSHSCLYSPFPCAPSPLSQRGCRGAANSAFLSMGNSFRDEECVITFAEYPEGAWSKA